MFPSPADGDSPAWPSSARSDDAAGHVYSSVMTADAVPNGAVPGAKVVSTPMAANDPAATAGTGGMQTVARKLRIASPEGVAATATVGTRSSSRRS